MIESEIQCKNAFFAILENNNNDNDNKDNEDGNSYADIHENNLRHKLTCQSMHNCY